MKKLFILIFSIFSAVLFLFLTASLLPARAGCQQDPECNDVSDCGPDASACKANCCIFPDPCDGTTCGSCSGSCGGGTGSVQCHDSCSNWFESCTNNDPCPPPPTPTPGTTTCDPQSGKDCGNNVRCCTTQAGADPCTFSGPGSFCQSTNPGGCTSANDCPNASVQQQCGGKACSIGKLCVSGSCEYFCIGTPPCGGGGTPPPGVFTCSVTLSPNPPGSMPVGSTLNFTATVNSSSGPVDRVDFFSSNTGVASVSPTSDTTSPYQTTATGVSVGTTTISTSVVIGGVSTCSDATTTTPLTVTAPIAWWQVKDADVITNGSLSSQIPSTCTSPQCNPTFDLDGYVGGYPGIPSYGGTADFNAGAGTGVVSSKSWLANTSTTFRKAYDYSFFKRQIPSDVQSSIVEITSPSVNGGFFNSGGAPARGYVWYHYDGATYGDLTMNGNLNLTGSRKVVLLVEGANFLVNGRINIQSKGNGFFMVVVGKNANGQKGNIVVDPTVSHPTQPGLEGIYYADGTVSTGVGNNWLWLHGSVAAQGGISLQRNLTDNSRQPAEYFEYAPEIMVLYPNVFTNRRIRWKEVAP